MTSEESAGAPSLPAHDTVGTMVQVLRAIAASIEPLLQAARGPFARKARQELNEARRLIGDLAAGVHESEAARGPSPVRGADETEGRADPVEPSHR